MYSKFYPGGEIPYLELGVIVNTILNSDAAQEEIPDYAGLKDKKSRKIDETAQEEDNRAINKSGTRKVTIWSFSFSLLKLKGIRC